MTQFLHTLLNMSLTAAFVAVIVFLLRLVLKGRAARQTVCLLWLIVFARLLIPVTLQSPVSLVPDMEMNDPAPVVSTAPEAVSTQPVNTSPIQGGMTVAPPVMTNPVQTPVVTIPPNVSAPDPVVSAPAEEIPPVTEEPAPFPWGTVLTAVWAAGVAAMLAYGVGSYLSIRRKLRFAIRTKEGWWEDPHLRSPFILGLVRPKIYLPCHMTPYARRFILCHERAHIRRGDHIIKPICWLALALHWFNPLAWAAFLLLSRDIEVACDEKVLRELGQEVKADYSATLLALATNGRFPAPTPLAFGEGDAKSRIKSVLSFRKPALWVTVAAVVVAIVAAVCLLTDPVDKFDPDDYTTQDCYPGLYFEQVVDEAIGETTVKAYRVENGRPVPVAGWMDQPGDNLAILIHPDGEREILLAAQWEMSYRYEQYLVDYMMEQDEGWARRYLEEADDLITIYSVSRADLQSSGQIGDLGEFYGGIAYTPEENLLFCRESTAQVLPRWTPYSPDSHTVEVYPNERPEDGIDRWDILWTGKDVTLAVSSTPGGLQTYTGDALITYLWDGETWTAHNSADAIAFTDKPVSFDAGNQRITVTYDPNAHTNGNPDIAHIDPGMIRCQFSIPAELGRVQTIAVGELAGIARREDGDYDLTYSVLAMPEGKSADTDWVHILDLTAILKWNTLTEEFEITFTGAEEAGKTVIGEGTETHPVFVLPEGSELLASLPEEGVYLYTRADSWRPMLRYGEHTAELDTTIETGRNPVRFFPGDRNADGITEIVMLCHKGWGTGYDAFGLMACWADDDGLHVEYHDAAPLWKDFNSVNTFSYDETRNVISVAYGEQSLSLQLPDSFRQLDWASFRPALVTSGDIARYASIGENRWQLSLDPGLSDGMPVLQYLPMNVNYTVEFTGTEFRMVDTPALTAESDSMLVQPYTVTMLDTGDYCSEFRLTLDGQEVLFEGGHMTEQDILTYYFDMTGDGVADPVVFLVPGMGTGPVKHEVHIFDGVTLKEYPDVAKNLWNKATEPYTLTADGDNFYITADGMDIVLSKADILAYWADSPAYADINFLDRVEIGTEERRVTVKDGMLCVINTCMVGDYWQHYGRLETYLVMDGQELSVVRTVYVTPDGREVTQQTTLTTLASLPEEGVYLYTDGAGSFRLGAYGHDGPVPILNAARALLEPSTAADLRRETAVNLSGPDFEFISFTMKSRGVAIPLYYALIWDGEQNVWRSLDDSSPLSTLSHDIVTDLTYPADPEWYYKVAETGQYELFARNGGQEILLTWGNLYQSYDHDAHTGRMNLPVMKELEEGIVAVISEVNSGTGVGVDELVVYDLPIGFADYLYDWRDLAADFNRSNTLTYDKATNTLTLEWNGATYNSGKLAGDLSVAFELEDGFAGALIATGDIIRFTANEDGTFTARMETSIGRGNRGGFYKEETEWFWIADDQDSHYFPLSIGITGFDLVWTVKFTGKGFEVVDAPTVESTAGEVALQAYASFLNGSRSAVNAHSGESFTLDQFSLQVTPDETFRFEPTQYALVDLDGDGWQEMLLKVPNFGSAVLRFDEESIYAFFFAVRQFRDVKTDGTFSDSGGHADVSICRISFSGGRVYEVDRFTGCSSAGNTVSCFVDHKPAAEAEWHAAFNAWQQREGVQWFDLP